MARVYRVRHVLTSDDRKPCFAKDSHVQKHDGGPAAYLLSMVDDETGETKHVCACGAHAAWWCWQVGLQAAWAALLAPPRASVAYPCRPPPRPACRHVLPWEKQAS